VFFSAYRVRETGDILYKESERIALVGGPAPVGVAPAASSLSGLQLLMLMMKASYAAHSFTIPENCIRLLGRGGSACVYELPSDRAAKVYFLREDVVRVLRENEVRLLKQLPEILSSSGESLEIRDGNVQLVTGSTPPPHEVLVGEEGSCLIVAPVCEQISRARFNNSRGRAVNIVVDVVSVLRKLHMAGWVHGDIRRSNILLKSERGVLIDFAFSRHFDDVPSLNAAIRQEMARLALVLRFWCTGLHFAGIDDVHEYTALCKFVESPEWRVVLHIALESDFVGNGMVATEAYAVFIKALLPFLSPMGKRGCPDVLFANRSPDSGEAKANRPRRDED
jgi:hypothetical protein